MHGWERVAQGRYATQYNGHVLQAIRSDNPYEPGQRPYIAVVDRVPLEPGEWSLNRAKTRAIQFVERQHTKAKAERLFASGSFTRFSKITVETPLIPELEAAEEPPEEPAEEPPVDTLDHKQAIDGVLEEVLTAPHEMVQEVEENPFRPRQAEKVKLKPSQPSAVIFATITDPDLLKALAALKETLDLMREFAEVRCTVTLPPTLEL